MSPEVYIKIFGAFSISVIAIYAYLAVRAFFQYIFTKEDQAFNLAVLCASISVYAAPTYINSLFPGFVLMKVQAPHIYSIAGCLGLWAYVRSINYYLNLPQSNLKLAQNLSLLLTIIPIYSIFHTVIFNEGFLFSWVDDLYADTGGVYFLELTGAINKPNIVTAIFFSAAVPIQLYASYKLIQYLIKNKPDEKVLMFGIVLTFLLLLNEFNFIFKVHPWAMPMLFLTYTVESIRLSTALQSKYHRKLGELENDLTRISQVAEIGFTAGAICHDIRNPLGIAAGNSGRLNKMIKQNTIDPEKVKKIQQSLDSSLDRIAKIIEDYMALMRNDLIDNFDRHQLRELFNRAVELSMPKISKYGNIPIKIDVPDILYVECLENQIVLSIVNLISNSCDAIQANKEKWIELKGSFNDKNTIKIVVVDSGLGIPESAVDRIFESQFTTKKKGEGTGLGLDIVKRFIEAHSGQIYVDKLAENTTFVITLPIEHKDSKKQNSDEAA